MRRRAVTAPIAARPHPVKAPAPLRPQRSPDAGRIPAEVQAVDPVHRYRRAHARPSGAHPTATRARPTIDDDAHTIMINRVAWGAIFAGVVVALVVQVLLTMLGAGIGMATLDPASTDNPAASTFSITAAVWWVMSGIIAAFAGGYIAARMSGRTVPTTGAFHGLTTWAFTTLVVLYLLTTTAGSLVGGVFSGVASALAASARRSPSRRRRCLREGQPARCDRASGARHRHRPGGPQRRGQCDRQLLTGDASNADQRQQAAQALAQARNIPLEEARQQVARRSSSSTSRRSTRPSRPRPKPRTPPPRRVSTGALVAFVALVLGAIAGWFGGRSGVVHPVFADGAMPRRRLA